MARLKGPSACLLRHPWPAVDRVRGGLCVPMRLRRGPLHAMADAFATAASRLADADAAAVSEPQPDPGGP